MTICSESLDASLLTEIVSDMSSGLCLRALSMDDIKLLNPFFMDDNPEFTNLYRM